MPSHLSTGEGLQVISVFAHVSCRIRMSTVCCCCSRGFSACPRPPPSIPGAGGGRRRPCPPLPDSHLIARSRSFCPIIFISLRAKRIMSLFKGNPFESFPLFEVESNRLEIYFSLLASRILSIPTLSQEMPKVPIAVEGNSSGGERRSKTNRKYF